LGEGIEPPAADGAEKVTPRSPVEAGSEAEKGRSEAGHPPVKAGKILPDMDGRSSLARRARTVRNRILADLGGASEVSTAEVILIGKIATLEVQLAMIEQKMAASEGSASHADLDLFSRGLGHLRRTLESLHKRLARCCRDISPKSPLDILQEFEGPDDEEKPQ